jgi:signal peptidase I
MTVDTAKNRYATTFLSLLAPGLGHVYAGRVVQGLSLSGGTVAVGMLGTTAILASPSLARLALVGAAAGWAVLWVTAAVGAFRCARTEAPALVRTERPRWYVYVVLAVLTLSSVATWAVAVRERVAQIYRIPSKSMEPAIEAGDRVLVDKLSYASGPVRRGDVVVFRNPNERYQDYIKRVVALPGDTVEMRDDDVFVNGTMLPHVATVSQATDDSVLEEANGDARYRIVLGASRDPQSTSTFAAIKVPSGHCFLLGDNRHRSVDSRQIGPVPLADIVGRVDRTW